jgi:DnaJ domain
MSTLYDVLGVAPDADDAVIRQTFRELAKAYHPDVHGGAGPAGESFKKMTAAYAVLKHVKTRAAYDAKLALARRLARRERIREVLICAAGAVVSFSTVSSILLYRNASTSAYATTDVARQTEILQAWRSVVPDRAEAPPSAPAARTFQAGTGIAPDEHTAATQAAEAPSAEADPGPDPALVTGSLSRLLPKDTTHDPALPPGASIKPNPAPEILTTDIRVWARSAEFGVNGSPRYVARVFKVRRESSDRPLLFGRTDLLRRRAP